MRDDLEDVVQAQGDELQAAIAEIVRQEAADQPPEVRQVIEVYLNHVPAAIRRSLRRPTDPTGTTVSQALVPRSANDLLRLLPTRLPRFQSGDQPLPGVDWVLDELLGVGGFGEVWKAHNPYLRNASPVALKFCLDPVTARALRNEVALLDRVRSQGVYPGIVQLRQTYLSAETPALAYEYIAGGDLCGLILEWQRAADGPTPTEAAQILLQLAEIVGFAHRV